MSILHGLAALALAAASSLSLAQTAYKVEPAQVATDNARMLGEVKRVAITQLVLQLLDRQSHRVTSSGFRGGAAAKASLTLSGPGKEQ